MNRRTFIVTAASASRVLGANDRIRLALIGCGGRGRYVASKIRKQPGVEYVSFCDVHDGTAAQGRQQLGTAEGKTAQDFRRVLEDKSIDAVHIATPDHWHAIPTVLACQAGKDVYVEKPLGHNIREGRAMVEAARKHNRIVISGTQHRSAPHYEEVHHIVQSGQLGKITLVRVWNYSNMLPNGIGRAPDSDPPAGLDWEMYLGPAPKVPYNRTRWQGTFRWFWDYANGTITDFGTHRFDSVHQVMGVDTPLSVVAAGGRFALNDAGEMPDTMQVTYEYPGFVLMYEASNINGHGLGGRTPGMKYYHAAGEFDRPHGEAFYGTQGTLYSDRIGFEIYPENDKVTRVFKNAEDATDLHAAKFIRCLRNRKTENAGVDIGHRSTIIPLLGNIAYKTGLKLKWDAAKEQFINAPAEAAKLLTRQARKPWDMLA